MNTIIEVKTADDLKFNQYGSSNRMYSKGLKHANVHTSYRGNKLVVWIFWFDNSFCDGKTACEPASCCSTERGVERKLKAFFNVK